MAVNVHDAINANAIQHIAATVKITISTHNRNYDYYKNF